MERKAPRDENGRLSRATKDLIKHCSKMVIKTTQNKIEAVELSKNQSRKKLIMLQKNNMKIKETLNKGASMKITMETL